MKKGVLTIAALVLAAAAVGASPLGARGPNAIVDTAGCRTSVLTRNDDLSTNLVPLGFELDFFGTTYDSLYVNNNGNVTFTHPVSTYTPFSLITTSTPMIAPFFGDVDTTHRDSDVVRYGATTYGGRPAFCVLWAGTGVGYYFARVDKLNDFQLLLVDRSDVAPGDFDIVFNYDRIEWETGEASGGVGGLGGASARVGWSNGSTESFELAGSAVNGAFLDSNTASGLIHNSLNSTQNGRYIFFVRNGVVLPPPPSNDPPTVDAAGPYTVAEGSSVTLSATGADPDGDALSYSWDLDGDGTFETVGSSVVFSAATLDGPTTATVSVRVSDGPATATDTATVGVSNVDPRATFTAPAGVDVLSAFSLSLGSVLDPGPDTFEYRFDCGAGYGAWQTTSTAGCDGQSSLGFRTVRGAVRDDDGGQTTYTATITVVDRTAPTGACEPGTNPAGKNKPDANAGFRLITGADNFALRSIVVVDTGSAFVSAPFASGSTVKLTQTAGGPGSESRPGPGGVAAQIKTVGEPMLRITDTSGNVTLVSCGNLPPH